MRLHGLLDDAYSFVSDLHSKAVLWVQDATDSVKSGVSGAVDWVGNAATAGIRNFRTKLQSFQTRYQQLLNNPPPANAPQDFKDTYSKLLAEAQSIASKAALVESGIKSVEKTLGVTLGAVQALIIPAAIVAAIIGLIYLINNFMGRADAYIREKNGMKPPATDPGLFGSAASLVWPIAIAGAAAFLLQGKRL